MGRSERVQRPGERGGGEGGRERRASRLRLTFKQAVEQTPDLSGAWQTGPQGTARDGSQPDRFRGYIDVSREASTWRVACKTRYRDQRQWDYAVGYQPTNLVQEVVYWIEVHPANPRRSQTSFERNWNAFKTWLREHAAEA